MRYNRAGAVIVPPPFSDWLGGPCRASRERLSLWHKDAAIKYSTYDNWLRFCIEQVDAANYRYAPVAFIKLVKYKNTSIYGTSAEAA